MKKTEIFERKVKNRGTGFYKFSLKGSDDYTKIGEFKSINAALRFLKRRGLSFKRTVNRPKWWK